MKRTTKANNANTTITVKTNLLEDHPFWGILDDILANTCGVNLQHETVVKKQSYLNDSNVFFESESNALDAAVNAFFRSILNVALALDLPKYAKYIDAMRAAENKIKMNSLNAPVDTEQEAFEMGEENE